MSSKDEPAELNQERTETFPEQTKQLHPDNEVTQEESPTSMPQTETKTPRASLAQSALEASHADLPPLSNITDSTASNSSENLALHAEKHPLPKRGIGRGTSSAAANASLPSIGVVQSLETATENLSGQFANGYNGKPEHTQPRSPQLPQQQEQHPQQTRAEAKPFAPSEFVPPISQKTYKAEMNPEHERRKRERKSNVQEAGNNAPARRHNQSAEWSPGENKNGNNAAHNQPRPQKFTVDPPTIPEMQKDSLWTRFKEFVSNLFRSEPTEPAPDSDSKKNKHNHYSSGKGQGGDGHWHKYRGNRKNRYRHGNRGPGGTPQSFNRDGRHRPHAHGGENHY